MEERAKWHALQEQVGFRNSIDNSLMRGVNVVGSTVEPDHYIIYSHGQQILYTLRVVLRHDLLSWSDYRAATSV